MEVTVRVVYEAAKELTRKHDFFDRDKMRFYLMDNCGMDPQDTMWQVYLTRLINIDMIQVDTGGALYVREEV